MGALPAGQRILSVVTAFCCTFISAIAFASASERLSCLNDVLKDDIKCPPDFNAWWIVTDPFILLTLFFLISLSIAAIRTPASVARRTLLWWAILFALFIIAVFFLQAS